MDQNLWKTIHENRGFVLNVPSGLRQFYSTNNSSSPPYIQINYVSAKANSYRSISTNEPNCWRYAMLYNNGEYAPQLTVGNSVGGGVSNIVTCTQSYLRANGPFVRSAIGLLPFTAGSTGLRSDTIQSRTFQLPLDPAATTLSMNFRPDNGPGNTQGNRHIIMDLSTRT